MGEGEKELLGQGSQGVLVGRGGVSTLHSATLLLPES